MNSKINIFSRTYSIKSDSKKKSSYKKINLFKVINLKKINNLNNNNDKIKDEKIKFLKEILNIINNIYFLKKINISDKIKNKIYNNFWYFYLIIEKQIYLNLKYIIIKKIFKERSLFNPIKIRQNRLKELNYELIRLTSKNNKLKEKINIIKIKNFINLENQKNKYNTTFNSNLLNFAENLDYFYKNDKNILKRDMIKHLK